MFNVKTQEDFNNLNWDDRYRYVAQNPYSDITKNEFERTKKKLYTEPTDAAKQWYSGLSYASQTGDAENAILGSYNPVGYEWKDGGAVRGGMNARGITDDRIGWRDGKVTLDGKDFMTPDIVMGGRSYASDDALRQAFQSYNKANEVVPVRQYVNTKSPQVNVGWDGELGQVLVGSQALTPDYIENGVAYISKNRVNEALGKESASTGVRSYADVLNRNNSRWDRRIDRLYDRVENPDPFTWSADTDAEYQDFKREWLKQNQAQYDDTIVKLNSQSGGAPSLGAMAAAWNMLQDSNGQLDAYKQQFRQQAYNEWVDAYNRDVERLEAALGMRDDEFNREYGVNSDMVNGAYYRPQWESDMKSEALDREVTEEALGQSRQTFPIQLETQKVNLDTLREQLSLQKQLTPYEVERAIQQVKMGNWELSQAELEYLIRRAEYYGINPNFNTSQGNGGGSGSDVVPEPAEIPQPSDGYSTAAKNVINQVGNIATEPNRVKSQGLMQAIRYVMNSDLTDAEKKRILETPSYFNATQDEVAGAYERLYS